MANKHSGFSTKVKERYVDQVSITTDASLSGWGAVFGDIKTGGLWSSDERGVHIIELRTIWLALQALCSDYAYKTIKVFTDNSTTLAYVNNKGSRKSNLNDITRLIWLWALDNHVWIEA